MAVISFRRYSSSLSPIYWWVSLGGLSGTAGTLCWGSGLSRICVSEIGVPLSSEKEE